MRKSTFILPVLLIALLFLAGCGSNRSFGSRKYMAGNYISHKHKPTKPETQESPKEEPKLALSAGAATEATKADKNTIREESLAGDKTALGMDAVDKSKASSSTSEKSVATEKKKDLKAKAVNATVLRHFIGNSTERKCLAYDDGGGGTLDSVALVSFILGILGLALNILALSVIIATSEYIFTLMFIAGLVMGIIAVVFGTQGIRRNRKNKNGTINLVFSIVGTSLGGAAIITAFVFAFYTLIFFLESL